MENLTLTISQHARERFAERIMNKDEKSDIASYVAQNEQIIDERIQKMVEFGEEIYHGRSISEYNKSVTKVFLKDTWVVIVDAAKYRVITLYNIDLGLGDDFNKSYVAKLMEKLNEAKSVFSEKERELSKQKDTYEKLLAENEAIIAENKRINKELEKQNTAYRETMDGVSVQIDAAQSEIKSIVGTIVGRKVY